MMEFTVIEIIKVSLLILAALFTYFRFFSEGTHKQRIEFDIECSDLGHVKNERIIEVGVIAENKGYVEQKFTHISLKIYGLDSKSELKELENYEPRLEFPLKLHETDLISQNYNYYFVRPKIAQRFPITLKIPLSTSYILVKAKFNYRNGEFHTAERTFALSNVIHESDN